MSANGKYNDYATLSIYCLFNPVFLYIGTNLAISINQNKNCKSDTKNTFCFSRLQLSTTLFTTKLLYCQHLQNKNMLNKIIWFYMLK